MKLKHLHLLSAAVVALFSYSANATLFELNYSDPLHNSLSGLLSTTDVGPYGAQEEYSVNSATVMLNAAGIYSGLSGVYTLANGVPGSSAFNYDNNVFYPGQPIVDFAGVLVFKNASGVVLNLFASGPNEYALDANIGGSVVSLFPADPANLNETAPATARLTPIPETSTLVAGALLLLPFGASALRILQKNRTASR